MPIAIIPKQGLSITSDPQADQVFEYWVTGSNLFAEVMLHCEISLDARFNWFHLRRKIDLKQEAVGIWTATATYVRPKPTDPDPQNQPQFPPIHFELSGVQQHLTQSLETIKMYAASGETAPDFKRAVNVSETRDGYKVDGYDEEFPQFTWTEKYFLPVQVAFSTAYIKALRKAYNRTNSKKWRDFEINSVRFKGATGGTSDKFPDYAEITFGFESAESLSNLTYGSITDVKKGPFELLWIAYEKEDDDDAKKIVARPKFVYVERIKEEIDFATLRMPI